jgi:hypothetical protein
MIEDLRRAYNAAFTEEKYRAYCRRLEEALGEPVAFRLAETPVFLPPEFRDATVRAAEQVVAALSSPEHRGHAARALPPGFAPPGPDERPLFAVVDFAVTRASGRPDGALKPHLIELQAFPSLYGFQLFQGREIRRLVPGGEKLSFLLSGLDEEAYVRAVGEAILGGHDPADVVLLDLDPRRQKTACDFAASERLWGVAAVCPTEVVRRGRELWHERGGTPRRILRVYNRVILDEVAARGVRLPFDFAEPLEVEWAHHPAWYFLWSKHSIPWLRHPAVPEAVFLSDIERPPEDLERWVLKPLFSFAGSGVKVDLSPADLEAVPPAARRHTLLMRKVEYAPVVATADGNFSKCEVRVMFVWRGGAPLALTTLIRLSQGKMMGVDHNKDRTWVGSSCGLWP